MLENKRDVLLSIMGATAGLSVPLYVLSPRGTTLYFGGQPSPTTSAFVRLVGSGDLLVSLLAFSHLGKKRCEQLLAMRWISVYSVTHMLSFLAAHWLGELKIPLPTLVFTLASSVLGAGVVGYTYWTELEDAKPTKHD